MTDLQNKGKIHLVITCILIILLDIFSTSYSLFKLHGFISITEYINQQILFRTFIYGILVFFCFKGYLCAKWILSVLALASGGLLLINFNITSSLAFLVIGIILIFLAIFLLISKPIKLFMSYQISNIK